MRIAQLGAPRVEGRPLDVRAPLVHGPIRERIRLLHGAFSVESNAGDGGGATLQVRVPFEAHHDGRTDRPEMPYHPREGFEHGAIDAAGSGGSSG